MGHSPSFAGWGLEREPEDVGGTFAVFKVQTAILSQTLGGSSFLGCGLPASLLLQILGIWISTSLIVMQNINFGTHHGTPMSDFF